MIAEQSFHFKCCFLQNCKNIAAEAQQKQNRISERVIKEYEPKRTIQVIDEMLKNKQTFVVENPKKVKTLARAIPQWSDSGAPIETQIKEFVETLNRSTGKPVMNRLNIKKLHSLLSDVLRVLKFLDDKDDSKTGGLKYLARQSSRSNETTIVMPSAKTTILMCICHSKGSVQPMAHTAQIASNSCANQGK